MLPFFSDAFSLDKRLLLHYSKYVNTHILRRKEHGGSNTAENPGCG